MWSIKNEFAIILIVLATTSIEIHANELSEGELKFSSRLYEVSLFAQIDLISALLC